MKKIKLASLVLGVSAASTLMVSCGSGDGSTASTGAPTSANVSLPTSSNKALIPIGWEPYQNPLSNSKEFSLTIYPSDYYSNAPDVILYINGKPVRLALDTAACGLLVWQNAVNIPQSAYTSQTFYGMFGGGTTFSGTVAYATVCANPSNTNTCVYMPIAVQSGGNSFTGYFSNTNAEAGDFGPTCGTSNVLAQPTPNIYGYTYYLNQQNPYYNAVSLSYYPLQNGYSETASYTQVIGHLTYGSWNSLSSGTVIPYSGGYPSVSFVYPSNNQGYSSITWNTIFDTGSSFVYVSTNILQAEIPNFSKSLDETTYWSLNVVNPDIVFTYEYPNIYTTSFTTQQWLGNLNEDIVEDVGNAIFGSQIIGLSEMLRHQYTWHLNSQGFVDEVAVSP